MEWKMVSYFKLGKLLINNYYMTAIMREKFKFN